MKNIILLPGNSLKNKEWANTWALALKANGFNVHVQQYDHWDTGREFADIDIEVEKLVKTTQMMKGDYVIFAKSIGSFIAMNAVIRSGIQPKQCIFFGFPFSWLSKNHLNPESVIALYINIPTTLFQNSADPITPYLEVQKVVQKNTNIQCVELKDDTHNYFANDDLLERVLKVLLNI